MDSGLQEGRTRWSHYRTGYHLVWIPKYRRKVLTGAVADATKELIRDCCARHGLRLLAAETDVDHVHVFVSAPPRWSPAQLANLFKGHTSRHLRERFPELKRLCGREQLWTQAYYVGTVGQVSAATVQRYIEECQGK
jgi:putative transposase